MSEVKDWGARVAFFGLTRGYVMALEDVKEGRPASPPSLKSPEIKRVTDAAGDPPVTSFRSKPDSLRIFTHRDGDQDQMVLYVFSTEKTDGDSHLRYAALHMETDGEVTALVSDRRDRGQIESWDATDNVLAALKRIVAFCQSDAPSDERAEERERCAAKCEELAAQWDADQGTGDELVDVDHGDRLRNAAKVLRGLR